MVSELSGMKVLILQDFHTIIQTLADMPLKKRKK
jgi:hypothetical protein